MQTRQDVPKDFRQCKAPKDLQLPKESCKHLFKESGKQSAKEPCNHGGDFVDRTASSQGHDLSNPAQKRLFWENHLEQCSQSPLTQKAYCEKHDLKIQQFYYWKRRLASSHDEVSFLPVALSKDSSASYLPCAVRIVVPNGAAIELEGPVNLAEVLSMAARL